MIKTKFKRKTIRLITYTIALIICLGAATVSFGLKSQKYEYSLRASQQNAVVQLAEYVDNIGTELHKCVYSKTPPMITEVSSNLTRDCSCAKAALSQIAAPDAFLENTYKFLSQVGDYANSINSHVQNGSEITDKEREQLDKLLNYATALTNNISTLVDEYASGEKINISTETINTSLMDIEQSFSDYPSLIYDGPFSDHMGKEDAEMLSGLDEITEGEARKKVSDLLGIEEDKLLLGTDETGTFSCYNYSTNSTGVSITKKGGFICTLLSTNRAGEAKLSVEEVIGKGKEFLESAGFKNMKDTYYSTDDGICTINFAHSIGNTICYTDLVKVGVSLDNGRILTLDSRGYIMNHKERTLPQQYITEEEARNSLAPNLTVKNVKLALIPSESDKEYFCYEFLCTGTRGEDILVYVDALTGVERDILLLLYSDGGTLTK